MTRRLVFVLAVIFVLGIVAPASAAPEVVVGAIYPLSGPTAPAGKDVREGIEMALEIINGSYDLDLPFARTKGIPSLNGAPLRYVFGDHQGQPEKALSETERLITVDKVALVQGAYQSSCSATASQACERLKVAFLADTPTSPGLHRRGFQYFFRIPPHDGIYADNFFKFIKEMTEKTKAPPPSIGIVWENTLYGRDVGVEDRGLAKKYGYEVVADISYTDKSTDLTSEVQQIRRKNPRILLHASYVSDAILFMRSYKELEVNPDMIFGHGAGFINDSFTKELGKDAEGVLVWESWSLDQAGGRPMLQKVNDMFKAKYGRNMNGHIAVAFTSVFVVADAVNRAKSVEPEAIRKALAETDIDGMTTIMPWEGIKFGPDGQNTKCQGLICQIRDGRYRTVWPEQYKVMDVVWPLPTWGDRK